MTEHEIVKLATLAGFTQKNGFSNVIVRHANGSWVDIYDRLARFATLVSAAESADAEQRNLKLSKFKILTITTAYEQGVGKGLKEDNFNPYVAGTDESEAWNAGYEEGLSKKSF